MHTLPCTRIGYPTRRRERSIIVYHDWIQDFERRLALHDEGVVALARDLELRTDWRVQAGIAGFPPPPARAGLTPDVVCDRGAANPPVVFEVELPETLVRRDTVARLRALVEREYDARLVLIADDDDHAEAVHGAGRLLRCAGIEMRVAAISPRTETLTGSDW